MEPVKSYCSKLTLYILYFGCVNCTKVLVLVFFVQNTRFVLYFSHFSPLVYATNHLDFEKK
jgi:hypothetical protein